MAEEPEEITQEAQEWYISLFGVDGPQHDSEARSEHRIPKAPAKFREYEKDKKYFDPLVVSLGPYHYGEVHVTLSQMAEDDQQPDPEPRPDPSEPWFFNMFGVDDKQPDPDPSPKHWIPKVPTTFREYQKDKNFFDPQVVSLGPYHKNYFDPQVVSLGPYHHGEVRLKSMEEPKFTAAKRFVDKFVCENEGKEAIYRKFIELKEYYDADVVAETSDDVFARMMFLDGCFVLHFIDEISEGAKTTLKISTDLIPLIIRDMFLIENQLPFEVLDALMNLRDYDKKKIRKFFKWKVLDPMGIWQVNPSWSSNWRKVVDGREQYRPLHLLDILRTILLYPLSKRKTIPSYGPRYFGSVMELKENGIRFEKRIMKSLMGIGYKENLLFPRLLLSTMYINDTSICRLLNLTAFEACSEKYSGCGVTSYIHFMDSIIKDGADVKELRSKGILHHSLHSDDEVARLFSEWPADLMNDLELYSDIRKRIRGHRKKKVKICMATWLTRYFKRPWIAISALTAALILGLTATQTYFTASPRG